MYIPNIYNYIYIPILLYIGASDSTEAREWMVGWMLHAQSEARVAAVESRRSRSEKRKKKKIRLYNYIGVLMRLYMCPYTGSLTLSLRRGWLPLSHVAAAPHTAIYVSSYDCICVLILLYMCPRTTMHVSSYYYMCPHTTICVLILLRVLVLLYVSSYYCMSVRILLCVPILQYMCPHATV
jgi:hypothetical protein